MNSSTSSIGSVSCSALIGCGFRSNSNPPEMACLVWWTAANFNWKSLLVYAMFLESTVIFYPIAWYPVIRMCSAVSPRKRWFWSVVPFWICGSPDSSLDMSTHHTHPISIAHLSTRSALVTKCCHSARNPTNRNDCNLAQSISQSIYLHRTAENSSVRRCFHLAADNLGSSSLMGRGTIVYCLITPSVWSNLSLPRYDIF